MDLEEGYRPTNPEYYRDLEFYKDSVTCISKAASSGFLYGKKLLGSKVLGFSEFDSGRKSIVYKIHTEKGPSVVKITDDEWRVLRDALAYEKWKMEGVETPGVLNVYRGGGDIPLTFMSLEYVKEKTLSEAMTPLEIVESGRAQEIGEILAKMHRVKAEGYGIAMSEPSFRGLEDDFQKYLENYTSGFSFLVENGVLDSSDEQAVEKSVNLLVQNLIDSRASLIHDDITPDNIISTNPLTIIDPNPKISHPAIDLSVAMFRFFVLTDEELSAKFNREIVNGYGKSLITEDETLAAAAIVRSVVALKNWHRNGKVENVRKLKQVFNQMKVKV